GVWVQSETLQEAGLQTGDKIISADGQKIDRVNELSYKIMMAQQLMVERNGVEVEVDLPVDILDKLASEREQKMLAVTPRIPLIVSQIPEDSHNKEVLQPGDFITAINDMPIKYADQIMPVLEKYKNQTVAAKVKRDDQQLEVSLVINEEGKAGFAFPQLLRETDAERLGLYEISHENYSLAESIPVGINKGIERLVDYGQQLKKIVNPDTGAYKSVGG